MVTRNSFVMLIYLLPKTEILREGQKSSRRCHAASERMGVGTFPAPIL